MNTLKEQIVFITGASSGIGKACAAAFAEKGSKIIISGRNIESLESLKNEMIQQHNISVLCYKMDVRDQSDVETVVRNLPEEWKNIRILINNAGLALGFEKFSEGSPDDWNQMIDTNVKGLLYVTRQILPLMIEKMSGHVINIGSTAGHEVYPNGNVYCATKFAVNALTQAIRMETIDKNIRVTTVDPGMVLTNFSNTRFSGDIERANKIYEGVTPLSAEDISRTILFCASQPENVNISEIILTPIQQASVAYVHRKK